MGCNATPAGFQLAGRTPLRVLVKPSDTHVWFLATAETQWTGREQYVYSTLNDKFWVYTEGSDGSLDIWIVF